jgi:pimeloyl-ACP methyl ester carboxylesterase
LRNWAQQIDEFAKHYRVIAYSRRYHYPNPATGKESDYTFKQNAADLLALISEMNLGRVHAIGHGYGGAVVATAALQKPDAFRSIVLMEPPFETLLPERQSDAARYSREVMLNIVRKDALKRQNREGAAHSFVDWSHSPGTWDALSGDTKQRFVDNVNALAAYSAHPEPAGFQCEDGQKLGMPSLIVQGAGSAPNPRIIASTLAECIPHARKVNIPRATHWMHRENPADFNQAVLEFLGSVK